MASDEGGKYGFANRFSSVLDALNVVACMPPKTKEKEKEKEKEEGERERNKREGHRKRD